MIDAHIIDKIEILTVKLMLRIEGKIEIGTGVILNKENENFVLTVNHTVYGKEGKYNTKPENLCVECFNGENKNVTSIESLDKLVLLKIENIDFNLPSLFLLDKAFYEQKYYLRGFPEAIKQGAISHPFNDVICDSRNAQLITLNIKNMNDDSSGSDTIENIRGVSGSGVFFEHFDKLFLVGCINELPNTYGVFNCAYAYSLLNLYKAKTIDVFFDEFRTVEDIAKEMKEKSDEITEDELKKFKEDENKNFNNLNRKHETILHSSEIFKKNKLRIEYYLKGNTIIDNLEKINSTFKGQWFALLKSMLKSIDVKYGDIIESKAIGRNRLADLTTYVNESTKNEFKFLTQLLLEDLSNYVIAKWLLDCDVDFIIEKD